jgi:hypothetical protein
LVHAERAEADVDTGIRRRRLAVAIQIRIRGERGVGVARHVDLGHDGHKPILSVFDDLPVLLLRVKAACSTANFGAAAMFRKVGPGFHFDPPSLVVGQVQMQSVQLVQRD